ncbi:MAG: hypothetical protein JJ896_00905 [Rhodothermales bacterium]|nr:hypothetical protein [Rhodothermales bacterium]MBO6778187.1 hypothetical protein [Rhodothermales bacterium]
MKRVSLGSIDHDDLISIILAHPMAGKFVASLIEGAGDNGLLASYAAVFKDTTVCLRVPNHVEMDTKRTFLLVWHGAEKSPWRVESVLLPRDAVELRLLAAAASTATMVTAKLPIVSDQKAA